MSQHPFSLGIQPQNPFKQPIKAAVAPQAATAAQLQSSDSAKRYNPFLTALNTDSTEFKEAYGINKPLNKPMLLGYRDAQPVYGGSRLFILY